MVASQLTGCYANILFGLVLMASYLRILSDKTRIERKLEAQDASYSKQPIRALTYFFYNYLSQMLNKVLQQMVFCFNHIPACACVFLVVTKR